MAEITQELMYEVLKNLQHRFDKVDHTLSELRSDMVSVRAQVHVMQGDINGLRSIMIRVDDRVDCIENRLELRELPERAQVAFDTKG